MKRILSGLGILAVLFGLYMLASVKPFKLGTASAQQVLYPPAQVLVTVLNGSINSPCSPPGTFVYNVISGQVLYCAGNGTWSTPDGGSYLYPDGGALPYPIAVVGGIASSTGTVTSPGAVSGNTCVDTSVSVPGAVLGQGCVTSASSSGVLASGLMLGCYVNAANNVMLRACNVTAGSLTPAPGTYTVNVFNKAM